ncbi:MAG TPA: sensor domain-containing diguanylate cyclase [Lachnospiraceae bacterium]|nr:sensor domain-containing diguanylate cyclase [Lachnospiraceae bacterium]
MELNTKILSQKKFSLIHRYLVVFLVVYQLERFAYHSTHTNLLPLAVIIPLFLVDLFSSIHNFYNSRRYIIILRLVQVVLASYFTVTSDYIFNMGISLLCLTLFFTEYVLAFDYEDTYIRIIALLTGTIPVIAILIIDSCFRPTLNSRLFPIVIQFAIMIVCAGFLITSYANVIGEYNFQLFSQTRLIEDINQSNEELRKNQEKVKKSNELLGEQKVKLEQAYREINSVNCEMMIQNEIIKYISASLDIDNLMTLITESVLEGMGLDLCILVLTNEDNGTKYKARTKYGLDEDVEFGKSIESGYFRKFVPDSKVYVDNYVDMAKYKLPARTYLGSILMVPLYKHENHIGELIVAHAKRDYFTTNVSFFEGIVAQFLVAIDNANLYEKMERMATHDSLTGIYNRGNLTKNFNEYLSDSILNKKSLSVALFDIDKFKKVNDSYGHLFGDIVIKKIASIAKEVANEYNAIIGRYGGEEFVIVFPNSSLEGAIKPVEELHQRIKETEFEHNGEKIFINISIGIASYPETCKNPAELLNRADWAMYYSKQNGRGRITIDSDYIRETVMLK